MAKKGKALPRREVTKRRLARWQRERRRRRITTTIGVLVIAVVIGIIIYGVYVTVIAPPRQLLSTVNGTSITAADYREALRLYPYLGSPEVPLLILEENELVRQGAEANHIGVTDDEIDQRIRENLEAMDVPLSEEDFEELYQQLVADSAFRESVEVELLRGKLEDYLKEQVPDSAEQVNVQAIVVANETVAQVVVDRLDGEDFASIAEEYGDGDLGWLPRGIMSLDFDEVAFSIEIGNVSQPFSTAEGYYIIKVLEKEDRALDEDVKGLLETIAFSRWIEEQREEKVNRKVDEEDLERIYMWALEQIGG
jgi:foldase protein PrsA